MVKSSIVADNNAPTASRLLRHADVPGHQPRREHARLQPGRHRHPARPSARPTRRQRWPDADADAAPRQPGASTPRRATRRSSIDQRNIARPSGAACDLGAVELAPLTFSVSLAATPAKVNVGVQTRAALQHPDVGARHRLSVTSSTSTTADTTLARIALAGVTLARIDVKNSSLAGITLARIMLERHHAGAHQPRRHDACPHPHHRNQRRRWLGGVAGRDGVGERPAADAHHGRRARRSGCRSTAAVARPQQARRQLDAARRDPTRVVRLCRTDLQHVAARFVERRSRARPVGCDPRRAGRRSQWQNPLVDGARPHRRHRCNARPHHSGPDRSAGLDVGTDHTLQHRCGRRRHSPASLWPASTLPTRLSPASLSPASRSTAQR